MICKLSLTCENLWVKFKMILASLIKDENLTRTLEAIRKYVKVNLLRFWQIHAPHFVDHGESHCESIESLLSRIIPDSIKDNLSEYEIFLLLCGVWLHDIGMLSKEENETDEQVRENHHERSRTLIRKNLPEIELTDDERYIVGEIAFFHRKIVDINLATEIYETQVDSKLLKVRVKLLCALVRLADGCEIAHSRSSRKLLNIASINEEAKFHHEIQLHVSAIDFDHISQEIFLQARVKDEQDALKLSTFLKSGLEKELSSVKEVLSKNGIEFNSVKINTIIDILAEELPKSEDEQKSISLEKKLVEIEKMTGYYPSLVIEEKIKVHIFYETIAQTAKEIQSEILTMFEKFRLFFSEKQWIFLTLNRIHNLSGTTSGFNVEIITAVAETKVLNKYTKDRDKQEAWKTFRFFKRAVNDVYLSKKASVPWKLIS